MVKGTGDVEFNAEDKDKKFYDRKLRQLSAMKANIEEATGFRKRRLPRSRRVRGLEVTRRLSDTSEGSDVRLTYPNLT